MTNTEQRNYDSMANALCEAGVDFEDTTYGNDLTASISVLMEREQVFEDIHDVFWYEEFQIYIPNSDTFDPENEEFNTFSVTLIEQGRTADFRRVEEVIDYLKSFTN